jgi:hypothetical protein
MHCLRNEHAFDHYRKKGGLAAWEGEFEDWRGDPVQQAEDSSRMNNRSKRITGELMMSGTIERPLVHKIVIASSIVALALLQTYRLRYAITDDECSYLDIARRLSTGDWNAALNGHWSPLYPLLISVGLRLSPDGVFEFSVIQIVNCTIFLFASWVFWWLWRALAPHATVAMECAMVAICTYSLLRIWRHDVATPDVLLAGGAFVVGRLMLYIRQRPEYWGGYVGLGLALAFSYFAKAVFFPISGLVLLLVVVAGWGERRKVIPRIAIAATLFIGIASPLLIGLSARFQHLTFGEAGNMAYAWYVAGVPGFVDWIGDPIGGHPTGPPKVLSASRPLMFSFIGSGTYPLWYEPEYWYRGVDAHASIFRQVKYVLDNLRSLAFCPQDYPQIPGLLALTILAWPYLRKLRRHWYLVAFGLVPIVAYCFILMSERYIAGFAVIVAASLVACFPAFVTRCRRFGLWVIAGAVSIAAVITAVRPHPNYAQIDAARRLSELAGLRPGTNIAIINDPSLARGFLYSGFHFDAGQAWGASYLGSSQELWAWIARLRIVGEIPPEESHLFDEAPADRKFEILELLI